MESVIVLKIFDDYRTWKLKCLLTRKVSPGKRPQLHLHALECLIL